LAFGPHDGLEAEGGRSRMMVRRVGLPLALLCAVGACSPEARRDPDVLVVAVRSAPNRLDPRFANDEASVRLAQLVFSPLLDFGDDLRVRPALAERIDNPDPLTYVVRLRSGVRFHDGRELTSADVAYTFSAFLDPAFESPFKGAYRSLQAVTALDARTVEFRLSAPFAAFPAQLVNTPPVVPAGSGSSLNTRPIGTGPYRFVRYDVDDQIVLSAFEDHWAGPPRNSGIVVKIVPDDTMRGLELRKGSVDLVANDLPPDIVYQLEQSGGFRVTRSPGLDFAYLGFNMRDPALADVRVRHAIGFAIDRTAIVAHLRRGLARVAVGLVPPQAWAFEPDVFQFAYDPARAERLLDDAGHHDPDGGGPQPRLRLTLRISTNEEARLQAAVVQQHLARVGIALEIRSSELATLFDDVLRRNFQVFSLQWVGGGLVDPDILRRVFHSTQVPPSGFNRGYYANVEVDRLIDRATVATDEETRREFYRLAQKAIALDAPYIPLWNRTNVLVSQPEVSGLHLNATGDFSALREVTKEASPSGSRARRGPPASTESPGAGPPAP
jgi:peptide/nickel transport system substrate-binding protein